MALYAQTTGTQQTNSGSFVPIPGLSFQIPEGVGTAALVILNLPPPTPPRQLSWRTFGINVDGTVSPVQAVFTYSEQKPPIPGRMPRHSWSAYR
jgi:hypothetical protein